MRRTTHAWMRALESLETNERIRAQWQEDHIDHAEAATPTRANRPRGGEWLGVGAFAVVVVLILVGVLSG